MIGMSERYILFYDTRLEPFPKECPIIEIDTVIDELLERQIRGDCVKLVNNSTAAIRIKDMEIDTRNKVALFLFSYSDATVSDPAFEGLETGELRIEKKKQGEGVAISAHMAISLTSVQKDKGVYLTLLEDVPGIGRTKIRPFLTSELKHVSKDINISFRSDDGTAKSARPIVQMDGYPSQKLKDDLQQGHLTGVELVRHIKKNGEFDEAGYVKTVSESVVIRTSTKTIIKEEATNLLNRLMGKAKMKGYDEMRVRFSRPEGKSRTVRVSTAREDAGDAIYNRQEIIRLEDELPQSIPKLHKPLTDSMVALLLAERDDSRRHGR